MSPDGGWGRVDGMVDVALVAAGNPPGTKNVQLKTANDSVDITGTYGLTLEDFNPAKEMQDTLWLAAYAQGLLKDVTALLSHPELGKILVAVNNPAIGTPYAMLYSCPALAVVSDPFAGTKLALDERGSEIWRSDKGWKVQLTRNVDSSDAKEWVIAF